MQPIEAHASSYLREDVHWGCDLDVLLQAVRQTGGAGRYLDLGCGPGLQATYVAETYPAIEVVGVDLSPSMLDIAERRALNSRLSNVHFVQSELLKYTDTESYEVVSCLNNTLNNLHDDKTPAEEIRSHAVKRMRDLLRPRGCVVLSVNNREVLRLENYRDFGLIVLPESDPKSGELFLGWGDETHYSHWSTEEEIVALLEETGFEVELLEKRLSRIVVCARST